MFKSVTFEVIGDQQLVCEGCEERVEHALKALQGVRQVRAQVRNQRIEFCLTRRLWTPPRLPSA